MSQRVESQGGLIKPRTLASPITPLTVPFQIRVLVLVPTGGGFNVPLKEAANAGVQKAKTSNSVEMCLIFRFVLQRNCRASNQSPEPKERGEAWPVNG